MNKLQIKSIISVLIMIIFRVYLSFVISSNNSRNCSSSSFSSSILCIVVNVLKLLLIFFLFLVFRQQRLSKQFLGSFYSNCGSYSVKVSRQLLTNPYQAPFFTKQISLFSSYFCFLYFSSCCWYRNFFSLLIQMLVLSSLR